MILVNENRELFYTLSQDGDLNKICDLSYRENWFDVIDKIAELLDNANKRNDISCLFRGESRHVFGSKTGIELNDIDDPKYDRFFIIGSKAKSYFKKKDNVKVLRQFDSNAKIDYIFKELNKLSKEAAYAQKLALFSSNKNFAKFKKLMQGMSNSAHRLTIENFFLAFIHTLSSSPEEINAHSVLISSTRDFKVAKKFSNNGFIIVFWAQNPLQHQAIDYNHIKKYNELLSKYDFPMIGTIHFPDEFEVTMFSAIFPDNIFYVYDLLKGKLVFNPYLINTDLKNILTLGINVDQSNFNGKLKGIYERSIWRCGTKLLYEREA